MFASGSETGRISHVFLREGEHRILRFGRRFQEHVCPASLARQWYAHASVSGAEFHSFFYVKVDFALRSSRQRFAVALAASCVLYFCSLGYGFPASLLRQVRLAVVCTVSFDWEETHFRIVWSSAARQACRFAVHWVLKVVRTTARCHFRGAGRIAVFSALTVVCPLEGVNFAREQLGRWQGPSSKLQLSLMAVECDSRLVAMVIGSFCGPARRCRSHVHRDMVPEI